MTKRQRRVGKVEDISVDIDALIRSKKRFKPSEDTSGSQQAAPNQITAICTLSDDNRAALKRNLVNSYIQQVVEHDASNELMLSKFKSMLKNIQVGNLTLTK